jgi:hypothetical protein
VRSLSAQQRIFPITAGLRPVTYAILRPVGKSAPPRPVSADWPRGVTNLAVPAKILGRRVTVLAAADLQGDSQRSSSTGGDLHSS